MGLVTRPGKQNALIAGLLGDYIGGSMCMPLPWTAHTS